MEKNQNTPNRLPYVKPEADLLLLRMNENIAASEEKPKIYDDEFDGEEDVFF